MPTFQTPDPIAVTIDVGVGDVRVAASRRADTVVEVRPSDSSRREDVTAAEQAAIEFAGGRLTIRTPRRWRRWSPKNDGGSVDVRIELPEGSELTAETAVATLHASGRLGACRCTAAAGDIQLDETGPARLRTSAGDVRVERIAGDADIGTSTGSVRLGVVEGRAVVKNSNGDSSIDRVTGHVRMSAANGAIALGRTQEAVVAKSGNGSIRLAEIARGTVVATTGMGQLEFGVADGAAAWLDLSTGHGRVRNELDAADAPSADEATVEVRARTGFGDITVRRA